jgi:N utilization substance protein B
MKTVPPSARRRARELVFRLAYQADLMGESYREVWVRVRDEEKMSEDQRALVDDVIRVLETRGEEVDDHLRRAAEHWELSRLAATDRSVLRAAIGELIAHAGTPARVVLDEAIEIAKRFGSEASGPFVNGVLDRAARTLRPEEL